MHGPAKLPAWLYPITGHTIGILVIIGVGIAKAVHEFAIVHWREDKRDEKSD